MNRKLLYTLVWGFLLILLFNGCRTNDEAIKNERQIQGLEYSSKTLWNEDEKYIKNVIKIYNQYKETVIESTQIKGEPFWDYAMTMGQFNESYLEVPVVNQEKVVQILRVIRKGSQVYFGSNSEEKASLDFFQQLIFGKYTKIKAEEERKGKVNSGGGATAYGEVVCTTRKISMWYPDNNNNPDGSGHWESKYETKCEWVEKEKVDTIDPCVGPECVGGGGLPEGGNPGFPYPDIENPNQEIINNLKDYPCAQKLLEQLPNLNNSLAKILKDALATNSKIKVTFEGGTLKGDKPGELLAGRTSYVETNNETGVVSYNIILNQDVLRSATQEYTLALMYHESIHAFLLNQHTVLGANEFFRQYPYLENYVVGGVTKFKFIPGNHQAYGPFVNMIADAIQSYNPKFPRDRAISLAMEGITEEDLPNNGDSYNTIERYSGDTAIGTKCAKP
ncbi:hypothetical protein HZQ67_18490 [Elizabethkingia anophelis]|nr:hypothetical protein [Elizabethkingia anophelis]